jgi:hypothetical protein
MTVAWVTCAMCGTELRDCAKFCDTCGCRLATSMQAEYEQVTVLFADVVRSMDIAAAVDNVFREGRLLVWGVAATGLLVEALLARGRDGDVTMRDILLPRLRALLADAHGDGDETANRDLLSHHREMSESLGFEGHVDWAEAIVSRAAQ